MQHIHKVTSGCMAGKGSMAHAELSCSRGGRSVVEEWSGCGVDEEGPPPSDKRRLCAYVGSCSPKNPTFFQVPPSQVQRYGKQILGVYEHGQPAVEQWCAAHYPRLELARPVCYHSIARSAQGNTRLETTSREATKEERVDHVFHSVFFAQFCAFENRRCVRKHRLP